MYHYVDDKEFLRRMKSLCGKIMQDFCHILKVEYGISATFYLVGSGAKNLITQNASEPVDLDYNLEIVKCDNFNDCRYLKESSRKAFNISLNNHGWGDCADSTSSLTTELREFNKGNKTPFSIDVCIVIQDDDGYYRLIHKKTGHTRYDKYYWNKAPHSFELKRKSDFIKDNGKWAYIRKQYLNIKNKYLMKNDHNHPSFICYVEAVNNVYNSRKTWN